VHATLDALTTALYVQIDDFLPAEEDLHAHSSSLIRLDETQQAADTSGGWPPPGHEAATKP